jgi:hypothetical protein
MVVGHRAKYLYQPSRRLSESTVSEMIDRVCTQVP